MTPPEIGAGLLRRCVVAGGSGAVGNLLTRLLSDWGVAVSVVDLAPPDPGLRFVRGDISAPDGALRAELAQADALLLAVPEPVALVAARWLPGVLRADAVLVDTLSVKSRIAAVLAEQPSGYQAVGVNPMFAPALGMTGRPVAAVVYRPGALVEELLGVIGAHGGRVVQMDASGHDRMAAAAQVLTHATVLSFGHALAELDVDIGELLAIAPPPHAALLALLARIVGGTPEVYWDVQAANPAAASARAALAGGGRRLRDLIEGGSAADFAVSLGELSLLLGPHLPVLQERAARLFAQPPAEPGTQHHSHHEEVR